MMAAPTIKTGVDKKCHESRNSLKIIFIAASNNPSPPPTITAVTFCPRESFGANSYSFIFHSHTLRIAS